MCNWRRITLCLTLLALPLPVLADMRLVTREYLNNRPTVTTTHWFGDDKSARDDGRTRTIMRFDLGRMYIIDPQARTYRSLALPDTPPQDVIVLATTDVDKIGNWIVKRWRVDGPAAQGYTINIWACAELAREDGFVELMQKLARQPGADWLTAYAKIEGIPIVQEISLRHKGMTQVRRSEVASYGILKPPPDTYLPPRGYKRIP
jgi:hypothetical protein